MPSRVLLISINRCEQPFAVFPLGLAYLDSALRAAGHACRLLDLNAPDAPLAEAIAAFRPDVVGLSLRNVDDVAITRQQVFFEPLADLCRQIRSLCDATLILGGSGFSIFPERLLELSGADFGIHGEGESSLCELLGSLTDRDRHPAIPGLVWRDGGVIRANPQTAAQLSAIPRPARPAHLAKYYLERSTMLNVQTQRGCSFSCCYCTYPVIEGDRFRRRDPAEVADEFIELARTGCQYAFVVDSVFNSSPDHVRAVCAALIRRGSTLGWGCFLRPAGLTRDLLDIMAEAGLAHIEFGSDSFCDPVLAEYGKRFRFDDILQSSGFARDAGVDFCHFLICGGPGETMDTLRMSYDNSQLIPGTIIFPSVGMRVYPGTDLHARALREGVVAPDADLLRPQYYISPGLSVAELTATLTRYAAETPAWIFGDPSPEYLKRTARLRRQGVPGPLWAVSRWHRLLRNRVFPHKE